MSDPAAVGHGGAGEPGGAAGTVGWERVAGDTGGSVGGLGAATVAGQPFVFAATSVGVYRSLDGGRTWTLAGLRNTVPFAEAVVPSARFEQDRTIFVGAVDGLHRSADGGETWQPVLVGGRMLSVASARADGRDGIVLLAGTEADGVLRSEDGGRTWTGANAGLLDLTALAIVVSPLFASDRLGFAGTASGLYRTRNGARSWREVETGLNEPAVQCVAMSPTFAADRLVLAGTEADGLLRSADGGGTWQRPSALVDEGVTAVAFSSRYPSKPTIAAAIESGVVVSEDGGLTWRRSAASPPGVVLSLMFVPTHNGAGEVLLAGLHRAGVAWSADDGASWEITNVGLSARLLTGMVLSPVFAVDQTMFTAGPQDGVNMSLDGSRTWAARNEGLDDSAIVGLALSPAYAEDRTLYAASEAGIHVSRDAGATWNPTAAQGGPARVIAAAVGTVLAGLSEGVLIASDDGAATWRTLPSPAAGAEILLIGLSPEYARDRTMFVATSQPAPGSSVELVLWRSVDGGLRWARWLVEREVGGGEAQRFMALAVSPTYATDEQVFVGLGARVFTPMRHARAVHAGQRRPVWRPATLGDGAVAVTAIAVSPTYAADQTVFAATNAGVFVSRDNGRTFQPWSEALTPPAVVALSPSPAYAVDRLVYAMGLGGTIWRRHDPSTPSRK